MEIKDFKEGYTYLAKYVTPEHIYKIKFTLKTISVKPIDGVNRMVFETSACYLTDGMQRRGFWQNENGQQTFPWMKELVKSNLREVKVFSKSQK